jgi:hypothetical protein
MNLKKVLVRVARLVQPAIDVTPLTSLSMKSRSMRRRHGQEQSCRSPVEVASMARQEGKAHIASHNELRAASGAPLLIGPFSRDPIGGLSMLRVSARGWDRACELVFGQRPAWAGRKGSRQAFLVHVCGGKAWKKAKLAGMAPVLGNM